MDTNQATLDSNMESGCNLSLDPLAESTVESSRGTRESEFVEGHGCSAPETSSLLPMLGGESLSRPFTGAVVGLTNPGVPVWMKEPKYESKEAVSLFSEFNENPKEGSSSDAAMVRCEEGIMTPAALVSASLYSKGDKRVDGAVPAPLSKSETASVHTGLGGGPTTSKHSEFLDRAVKVRRTRRHRDKVHSLASIQGLPPAAFKVSELGALYLVLLQACFWCYFKG